jgi:hypothetical protein
MTKERRDDLLRAAARQIDEVPVTADDGAIFWDVDPPLTCGELRDLLSQERTCSTCRHLEWAKIENYAGRSPECGHLHSAVLTLAVEAIDSWGCLLWEQADPKEPA